MAIYSTCAFQDGMPYQFQIEGRTITLADRPRRGIEETQFTTSTGIYLFNLTSFFNG